MSGAPLVEARRLRKVFREGGFLRRAGPGVRAVEGVSFRLDAGETLALVGESGCGKTTTARMVLGLEPPTAGVVLFDGRRVGGLEGEELKRFRRRAQMVFQDPFGSLNPRLTVGSMIAEPLEVHGVVPRGDVPGRVAELLRMVGLEPGDAGRYPHEFSGGQRQRIGVARALSVEPDLLVADEPVASLDVSVQAQVLNLLSDLQERLGLTMLFIAHDLSVVRHVADRVAVMYLGRIVEEGPADRLYSDPLHPYTRALLSAVPRPRPGPSEGRVVLPGDPGSRQHDAEGCPFYPRCPHPEKDGACREAVPPLEEKRERGHARCVKVTARGDAATA